MLTVLAAGVPGRGQQPGEDVALASWLPVLRGLTPHGLRHSLQTWMDEDGIPEVLKTEWMCHELPGMHGIYGHVSPAMQADLTAALQDRWEISPRASPRTPRRSQGTWRPLNPADSSQMGIADA